MSGYRGTGLDSAPELTTGAEPVGIRRPHRGTKREPPQKRRRFHGSWAWKLRAALQSISVGIAEGIPMVCQFYTDRNRGVKVFLPKSDRQREPHNRPRWPQPCGWAAGSCWRLNSRASRFSRLWAAALQRFEQKRARRLELNAAPSRGQAGFSQTWRQPIRQFRCSYIRSGFPMR